jgi:hypothetical protein
MESFVKHALSHLVVTCCLAVAAAGTASAQTADTTSPNETVLPTETIGSTEPTREAPAAARKEAHAVLAEAQRTCRRESSRDARRHCMAAAHEDFQNTLARAGIGS